MCSECYDGYDAVHQVLQEVPSVRTTTQSHRCTHSCRSREPEALGFDEVHLLLQEVPSVSSSAGSGQHSDPVWQVCWVDRGLEQEERLVTISTDGRVTQWATTKARHLPFSVCLQQQETQLPCGCAASSNGWFFAHGNHSVGPCLLAHS